MPIRPPTHAPATWAPTPGKAQPAEQPQARTPDRRAPPYKRGYDRTWQRLRRMYLRRYPVCEKCGAPATEVHHVHALVDGGPRLCYDNLQALCKPCHSRKTARAMARPDMRELQERASNGC